jgi:hypothetical protein
MGHRLREGGLKVQHGIIDKLKPLLLKLLQNEARITRIVPGVIKNTRGHGDKVSVRVTVPLSQGSIQTGWKAIAYGGGLRQEVFISTSTPHPIKQELETALDGAGAMVIRSNDPKKAPPPDINTNSHLHVLHDQQTE